MLRARCVCLFLFVAVILSLQACAGSCRMQHHISKDMYMRCAEAIAAYVKKTRNWDQGTYGIRFCDIDLFTNSAAFSVTSNAVMEDLERRKDTPEGGILRHHPDDFSVLVDIVDYVVLSENTLDTSFPNAKPGYERVVPYTPQK